jgi:murein DD-endopeptidase MepM/ murein hydrolase activator NlpD
VATYADVNGRLAGSKQKETGEFASAMRSWYSGTAEQRQAFDDALDNKLLLRKSAEKDFKDADDPAKRTLAQTVDNKDGTRTMLIGTAALELGSRMGLNVVFAHEAYRNGKDDGGEGQRAETNRAVEGHVDTALALMAGYGAGSVGGAFMIEAMVYDYARKNNDMATVSKIQEQYDSSADYWRLLNNGNLQYDGDGWLKDANGKLILDAQGKKIGANGVEGGLLKILGVDANDKEAVARMRQMMSDAGLQHSDGANPEDWQWRSSGTVDGEKVNITDLNMDRIIGFNLMVNPEHGYKYGNSMVTAVFMKGFDSSTDNFVLGDGNAKKQEVMAMPDYVSDRYFGFVEAKGDFYNKMQALVGGENSVSGDYQAYIYLLDEKGDYILDENGDRKVNKTFYENYEYRHFGIDLATGGKNFPIFAGISGTVIASVKDDANYGNYVHMEYGYPFEGYTYNTGIIGEYVHLEKAPLVSNKQLITAQTQLGLMGNTGKSQGIHLHYTVFTAPGKSFAENVMANTFGWDYAGSAMTNKPKDTPSTKTVYDPTAFYNKYKDIYTRAGSN